MDVENVFFQSFSRLICATNWSLKSMIEVLLNRYSEEILNFDFQVVIIVYSVFCKTWLKTFFIPKSIIERYSYRDAQYFKIVGPPICCFKKICFITWVNFD